MTQEQVETLILKSQLEIMEKIYEVQLVLNKIVDRLVTLEEK